MDFAKRVLVVLFSVLLLSCSPFGAFAQATNGSSCNDVIPDDAVMYNGHSYKVYYDDLIGWHDAQAFCEDLGGHLATVTSNSENEFVYSLVENSACSYWLGATDEESEGDWKWVTDEPWDYVNGSFDNNRKLQHYLTINHRGALWDDQSEKETSDDGALCDTGGFICEWETVSESQLTYFEQILGAYDGWYTAPQGVMGLNLAIYRTQDLLNDPILLQKYAYVANSCHASSDEGETLFTAEDVRTIIAQHAEPYIALFNYFPMVDSENGEIPVSDAEEGIYTMTVGYNALTGAYEFIGKHWIQHDTYVMADLKNITFTDNILSGDVYGEYSSWFWTEYGDLGDVFVTKEAYLSGYRIDLDCELIALGDGENRKIKAVVKNNEGTLPTESIGITWFSDDESVAKVTGNNWGDSGFAYAEGTVVGVSAGETKIYAKLGNKRVAACTVSVTDKITIKGCGFDVSLDDYMANLDSSKYDPVFANMLAALSAAAYDEQEIITAYRELGFTEDNVIPKYFPDSFFDIDPNLCAYAVGFKDSEHTGEKICLITVRGSSTLSDWIFNFDLLTAEEKHQGFLAPALGICNTIAEGLLERGIYANDVKYVITGHSRGAAIGNLLAVELMEQGVNAENVYSYNYACPDVACKKEFPVYKNIFNLCNRPDPVPLLPGPICSIATTPGTSWGKFGITLRFTEEPTELGLLPSHDMDLYLTFFNRQLALADWPYDYSDLYDDVKHRFNGWITKILCPVDVIVTNNEGERIASVINGEIDYYESNFGDVIIFTEGDKKVVYTNGENNFNVNLIGTDIGTMTLVLEKCDLITGEISESKTFSNIVLEKGKTMVSPVSGSANAETVPLFVTEEKDGETVYTHTIGTDGTETVVKTESDDPQPNAGASDESDLPDALEENDDEGNSSKTAIIIGVSVAGVILVVIACILLKKRNRQ